MRRYIVALLITTGCASGAYPINTVKLATMLRFTCNMVADGIERIPSSDATVASDAATE